MKFKYDEILPVATDLVDQLRPHCQRIEIAGSIRRKRPEIGDIEIVLIPKPYDVGLFASGIACIIEQMEKVKGELPCLYTQRILKDPRIDRPVKVDFFFASPGNWGAIFAIRTGSADFSKHLASKWVANGYNMQGGFLFSGGYKITIEEERDLFLRCGIDFVEPEKREI